MREEGGWWGVVPTRWASMRFEHRMRLKRCGAFQPLCTTKTTTNNNNMSSSLTETPSWAFELPASFQLVQNSEFPPLPRAAAKEIKPLTVPTCKRPATVPAVVAQPAPKQPLRPALSAAQMLRALAIDESFHAILLALTNPAPKRSDARSQRCVPVVCNVQSRMQHIPSSSFTSDVCILPKDIDISKCGDWSNLSAEVSVMLHAALVKQTRRSDFTVSVRFASRQVQGKPLHSVVATVSW
jgi:hypothetical protein